MAGSCSPPEGGFSGQRLPRPRLLVRRFRHGVGRSSRQGSYFQTMEESTLSINARELLAVERRILHFQSLISNSTISIFTDNSTAVAYLRKSGGTRSPALSTIAQRILRWAESHNIVLAPQFIMGQNNVLADALSRPNQIQGSEWTLKMEVFIELRRKWPVLVDLFTTSANHHCSLYFSPFHDPQVMGTDALLHSWDKLQVYAFPPWAFIPQVLRKLRESSPPGF